MNPKEIAALRKRIIDQRSKVRLDYDKALRSLQNRKGIEIEKSTTPEIDRYSYCGAALELARDTGILSLCPMRPKWQPLRLLRRQQIAKSYELKGGERWITVHPNGEDSKGQPILIKEHEDGSASVIAGVGGKLNGLRLRKTKSKEEYSQKVAQKKATIAARKEQEKAKAKAAREQMSKDEKAADKAKRAEHRQAKKQNKTMQEGLLHSKADEIAQKMGWQREDLDAKFQPQIDELSKLSENLVGDDLEAARQKLQDLSKAKEAAKKAQSKHIISQAREQAQKLKKQMLIDEQLREQAIQTVSPEAASLEAKPKSTKGLGIRKDLSEDEKLEEEEKAQALKDRDDKLKADMGKEAFNKLKAAREVQSRRQELVNANLGKTEYAAPDDTQAKLEALKSLMEYDKLDKHLKQEKKQLEDLDLNHMGIDELKKELENTRFGDGFHVDISKDELEAELIKAVKDAQTERQAALNSTLHDTFGEQAVSQKKWLANGAYNALNSASLEIIGADALDRDIVDILGASNAAIVLANQIKAELPNSKELAEAVEAFHADTNEAIAQKALDEGTALLDQAQEIDKLITANKDDLSTVKDLIERKQALIDRASALMGQALGSAEATAGLAFALKNKAPDEITVNLGAMSHEEAAQQAKVLGLSLNDVDIRGVKGERLMSIPKEAWDKICGKIDAEEAAIREKVDAIKAGLEDEQGWLPDGIVSRPFESFEEPARSSKAQGDLATQTLENNDNLKEAMHRSLGEVPEAGMAYKAPSDLTPQEQTALRRYWEREIYQGSSAEETNQWEAQKDYQADIGAASKGKDWNSFAKQSGGTEGAYSAIIQDLKDNHSTSDIFGGQELHPLAAVDPSNINSFKALPEAAGLFQAINDTKQNIEHATISGADSEVAKLETTLAKQEAELLPQLQETYTQALKDHYYKFMSGKDAQQYAAGAERDIKTPWGEYVRSHGDTTRAQEAVLDHLRGKFHDSFLNNHAKVSKEWLHTGTTKMRNHLDHVMGTLDSETRDRYLSQAEREMASAAAKVGQDASGKFASGSRREKALELMRKEKDADAKQQSLFGDADLKQKDGTDITSLGPQVEAQLKSIMPEASSQFQAGRKVSVFPGLSMSDKYAMQQRAVKMLEATGKMQLSFGTGSGKSLTSIGSFAHLHGRGKAKRALYAVPSVVQEQFGGEMQKFTQPGKFKWESRAGLSREDRIAALKDPSKQINVVTHQSLRDDLVHLMAQHDGTSEAAATKRFNAMSEDQRAGHLKDVLTKNGIDHDMLVVDESHYALDRAGKADSTLTNIIGALGSNSKYLLKQSATPVKNDISEAYHMLHSLAPDKYKSLTEFKNRYGLDTAASKRALQREISRYNYASPTETGVKRNTNFEKVKLTDKQAADYKAVKEAAEKVQLAQSRGAIDYEALKVLSPASFTGSPKEQHEAIARNLQSAVGTLRLQAENRVINQAPAEHNAKIQKISKIVQSKQDGAQAYPGVVFAHNREAVAQIEKQLKAEGHRVAVINGSLGGKEKERIKNEFNPSSGNTRDRKHDILVMSDAGATGLNLQNAKYLINYDLPDTSWVMEQRNGRIDRYGQQHSEIDYHNLVSDTDHDTSKLERIKRKAELGSVFQTDPNSLDDRGILSYIHSAAQEKANSGPDLFVA